jgi:hypothetical protein
LPFKHDWRLFDASQSSYPAPADSSTIANRFTVCDDLKQSGHLKNRTAYRRSTGCVSVNAVVVLQTVQGAPECM